MVDRNKALESLADDNARGQLVDARRGSQRVQDRNGNDVAVRTNADLVTALNSGAQGNIYFWQGNDRIEQSLEQLRQNGLTPEELNSLELAVGSDAEKAALGAIEGTVRAQEEGAGEAFTSALGQGLALQDVRGESERFRDSVRADVNPISSIAGSATAGVAALVGPGKIAKGISGTAKLAGLARSGAVLAGEAGITELSQSRVQDREFSAEAMGVDMALGGGASVLAKVFSKGVKKVAEKTALKELKRQKSLEAAPIRQAISDGKKISRASALKGAAKAGDVDQAIKALEHAGGDVSAATRLREHAHKIPGVRAQFAEAVGTISSRTKELDTLTKQVDAAWKKGVGDLNFSSSIDVAEELMVMARKAAPLAVNETSQAARGAMREVSDSMGKLVNRWHAGDIKLPELQERIHELTTNLHGKANSSSSREVLAQLRELKHSEGMFGQAAIQRKVADEALVAVHKLLPSMNKIAGDKAAINRLIRQGKDAELLQVSMQASRVAEHLDNLEKAGIPGFSGKAFQKQKKAIAGIREALQKAEGTAADPGPMRMLSMMDAVSASLADVRPPRALRESGGFLGGGVAEGLGGAIGGTLGGGFGAAIGITVARGIAQGALGDTVSSVVAKTMAQIDNGVTGVGKALKSDVARSSAMRTVGASSHLFMDRASKDETYSEISTALETAITNPDFLVTELESGLAIMEGSSIVNETAALASGSVFYLVNQLPKTRAPSQVQKDEFLSKLEMVQTPLAALDHLAAGTFTAAHRDALVSVYPKMYSEMVAALMLEVGDDVNELPLAQQLRLSSFTGSPVSLFQDQAFISTLRNQGAQTQQQDQVINGARNNLISRDVARSEQTGTGRIANK